MQLDAGGNPLGEKATANPTKLPSLKKQAELINRGWDERTFNGGFREGFGEKPKKPNEPVFDATSSPSSIYLEQFRKNADILFADAPTAVKELGETETFSLLSKLDAGMLDGWSGMTTNQQLALMKRTNLTPEQQWVLLNKRDEYLEGAAKAADLHFVKQHTIIALSGAATTPEFYSARIGGNQNGEFLSGSHFNKTILSRLWVNG